MSVSSETLRKLALYDTPTICNVIELFEVRPHDVGFMDARIRANFPQLPPMVGFATTATFRSSSPPSEKGIYASLTDQINTFAELPGPAVVVFQDLDDPPVGATFGEVMCSVYKAFGSVGLVTSGGGRDLEQIRTLNYPVFTESTICSHAFSHILHLGSTVRVGGLIVNHGDLLHGDANGVTNIPLDIADAVADAAEEFVEAEKVIIDYAREPGEKTLDGLRQRGREFLELKKKLLARIRRPK